MSDPQVERENMAKGCARAVTGFFVIISMIILLMLISCRPAMHAISPEGQVIAREGDYYLVIWPDKVNPRHSFAYNWVYYPGVGLLPQDDLEVFIIIQPKKFNP